jgi:hypothetical protein
MNKNQRDRFFKKIEAKYCVAQAIAPGQINDPWKDHAYSDPEWHVINQLELLQALKNVRDVMLIPHTYEADIPREKTVHPWGPTITFVYGTSPVPANLRQTGNLNIINQVENQINFKLGAYIHAINTEYLGENNVGQSIYKVTITQKA